MRSALPERVDSRSRSWLFLFVPPISRSWATGHCAIASDDSILRRPPARGVRWCAGSDTRRCPHPPRWQQEIKAVRLEKESVIQLESIRRRYQDTFTMTTCRSLRSRSITGLQHKRSGLCVYPAIAQREIYIRDLGTLWPWTSGSAIRLSRMRSSSQLLRSPC